MLLFKQAHLLLHSNTIGIGFRVPEDFMNRETLPFSSHFIEGDQQEPVTSSRPHSMPAAEPSSGFLVQRPSTRLGHLLLLFARASLRDLRQVPCPFWASVFLSNTWELGMILSQDLTILEHSEEGISGRREEGHQDEGRGGALKMRKSEDLGWGLHQAQLPPLLGTGAQGLPPQDPTLSLRQEL